MIQIEKTARKVELTRLVRRNRLLVRRIATRYAMGGEKSPGETFHSLERGDLEQEGTIGLIRAWDTFDPDRGVPLRAWATDKIRGYILDAIRNQGRTLRLPKDANTEYLAYRRAVRGYTERYGTSPTEREIAVRMGTTVKRVRKVATYAPRVVDIEGETGSEDGDKALTIEETLPEGHYTLTDHTDAVEDLLDSLPGRDAFLLQYSLGIYTPKRTRARLAKVTDLTVREVATELQRIKRGLRSNLRALALKKAAGYETVAELKARRARLPQHASTPRPKRPPRKPREPAPVHRYTLSEVVVHRSREEWKNPFLVSKLERALRMIVPVYTEATRMRQRAAQAWEDAAVLEYRARFQLGRREDVKTQRAYARKLEARAVELDATLKQRRDERLERVRRWWNGESTLKDCKPNTGSSVLVGTHARTSWLLPQGAAGFIHTPALHFPRVITKHDKEYARSGEGYPRPKRPKQLEAPRVRVPAHVKVARMDLAAKKFQTLNRLDLRKLAKSFEKSRRKVCQK